MPCVSLLSTICTSMPLLPKLESALTWVGLISLILLWVPMTAVARLLDREPGLYRCGRFFRRLGRAMAWVNRAWHVKFEGAHLENPRNPYVVVSNHLALADIPIISGVPWEMKWIAKKELQRMPLIGTLMRLVGDITVDRGNRASGARALVTAHQYLKQRVSVMFFPEGTRSPDGRLYAFNDGAFRLAIKAQVPILPLVIDGSQHALPRGGWRFGTAKVRVRILSPVPTAGLKSGDTAALREQVRNIVADQLAAWRGVTRERVDGMMPGTGSPQQP